MMKNAGELCILMHIVQSYDVIMTSSYFHGNAVL